MREALAQARRASGRTWPSPAVGAVVFRGRRVLGRGHTRPPGGPHAEIVALEQARRRAGAAALRGAGLAVTLEPCRHTGRTGPCADALIEAGVGRVWIGHRDPNPSVTGGGVARLRRAGVEVEVGVLEEACREQHRGFLQVIEHGRPFVALKLAATLDGRIATARGESRWISGERSRATVHRLRGRADAILVGSATARSDEPALTARRDGRILHRPVRVVLDSRLAVPAGSRLFRATEGQPTWVLAAKDAPASRRRALEARGARVLAVGRRGRALDLRAALRRLAREGLTEVLVEGGGGLAAALLQARLVDELHWFVAPSLLGGDARPALGPLALARLPARPALRDPVVSRSGDDVYVRGRIDYPGSPSERTRAKSVKNGDGGKKR